MPQQSLGPRPLVVGSAGQAGAALLKQLGPHAIAATRTPAETNAPIVDLAALSHHPETAAKIIDDLQPTSILCAGGATDVERCETDPAWAADTNANGPAALARAAQHLPFVFFSPTTSSTAATKTPAPTAKTLPRIHSPSTAAASSRVKAPSSPTSSPPPPATKTSPPPPSLSPAPASSTSPAESSSPASTSPCSPPRSSRSTP